MDAISQRYNKDVLVVNKVWGTKLFGIHKATTHEKK